MYGGLFGDLPAAKKSKDATSASSTSDLSPQAKKEQSVSATALNNEAVSNTKNKRRHTFDTFTTAAKNTESINSKNSNNNKSAGGLYSFLQPTKVMKKQAPSSASSAVVRNLGTVGTSMAFVPSAALQRQRQRHQQPQKKEPQPKQQQKQKQEHQHQEQQEGHQKNKDGDCRVGENKINVINDNNDTDKLVPAVFQTTTISSVKSKEQFNSSNSNKFSVAVSEAEEERNNDNGNQYDDKSDDDVHQAIDDPYDPYVPNDLLQYWEHKAVLLERKEIEREARETLEQQKQLQQQLEEERKQLQKEGDINKLVEHASNIGGRGRGRGRGRGVSNVPAWLLQKQKEQEEKVV